MRALVIACALALVSPAWTQDIRDAEPEKPAVRRRVPAAKPSAPRRAARPRRAEVATIPEPEDTRSPSWHQPHDEPPPPDEPEDRILIRRFAGRRFSFRVPR